MDGNNEVVENDENNENCSEQIIGDIKIELEEFVNTVSGDAILFKDTDVKVEVGCRENKIGK